MSKTLLLADDSMTIQKVVELTFMDQDYEVVAVSDGSSALEKLGEVNPDLVIADVHMPGADGYEVCRQTKAASAKTPVLLLVGTFEEFDEGEAASAGADGHLKKPFDSQELLKKVVALVSGEGGAAAPAPPAPEAEESPELTTQPSAAPQSAAPPSAPQPGASAQEAASPTAAPTPPAPQPETPGAASPAAATPPSAPEAPAVRPPQQSAPEAPSPPQATPEPEAAPPAAPQESAAPTPTAGSQDLQPSTADTRPTQARGPDGTPAVSEQIKFATRDEPGEAGDAETSEPEPEAAPPSPPAAAQQAAAAPAPEAAGPEVESAEPEKTESEPSGGEEERAAAASANGSLSDADVERIARKVIELSGGDALKEVAWEVVPDLAEVVIRERIAELEGDVE